MIERAVEVALSSASDVAGVALWRQTCRELVSGLRVVILGTEPEAAARLRRLLVEQHPRITFLLAEEAPWGAADALLGAHAVLWATPVTAALGQHERDAIEALTAVAPVDRGVVLTDEHLLERLSDNPTEERASLRARVATVSPAGWPRLDPEDLHAWVAALADRREALTHQRRVAAAAWLLEQAREHTRATLAESEAAVARTEDLLQQEDASLEGVRQHGERVAAHLLGSMRRNTEQLILDLRTFLHDLEQDLPDQMGAIDDLPTLRRTLPHWLDHVVEQWLAHRLLGWRAAVAQDIAAVQIEAGEARYADLVAPALHPPPLRPDGDWARRLALSAAVGGGALLALVGLWLPGAALAGGGLAWSALTREPEAVSRERLTQAATQVVRGISSHAERILQEQLAQIEQDLGSLGERRAGDHEGERAALRTEILEQRAYHRARKSEAAQVLQALDLQVASLLEPM